MTISFRIFLTIIAFASFYFVIKNIRKSKLLISDCIFWFFFSLIVVLLAIFPGIAIFFADLMGIQSPVNLMYLILIGLLLYLTFKQTIRISELETKITNIVQDITIERKDKK
jgi:Uncharacterized conserved protein